ncbi:MAG: hypothetical protein Q9M43_16055 [Sulfurimonas sp.]|nr:hypothetical protein [Sulfurimonas sp.]
MHVEIATVKETFLINCFNEIYYSDIGDFEVVKYIFEIAWQNKSFFKIKALRDSYLLIDTYLTTNNKKIPLLLI